MLPLTKLKGIHPGKVIERELARRKMTKGRFALSVGEYPQTLSAITKGTRNLNVALALRMEAALGLEEGFLMLLQVYYDIAREKKRQAATGTPDLSRLRPALFWDTRLDKIDWQAQQRSVIERVFSRGNADEQATIRAFYGDAVVDHYLAKINQVVGQLKPIPDAG